MDRIILWEEHIQRIGLVPLNKECLSLISNQSNRNCLKQSKQGLGVRNLNKLSIYVVAIHIFNQVTDNSGKRNH